MMITTESSLRPEVSILLMNEDKGRKTQNGKYVWIHKMSNKNTSSVLHTGTHIHTNVHMQCTHTHVFINRLCVLLFLAGFFKREKQILQ